MGSLLEDILFVETRNNARLSLEPRGGERRGVGGGAPDGMIPLSHALTHSKLRRADFFNFYIRSPHIYTRRKLSCRYPESCGDWKLVPVVHIHSSIERVP